MQEINKVRVDIWADVISGRVEGTVGTESKQPNWIYRMGTVKLWNNIRQQGGVEINEL